MARRRVRGKCWRTRKARFPDEASAQSFINRINSGPGLFLLGWAMKRAYQCEHCKGWHITKQEKKPLKDDVA